MPERTPGPSQLAGCAILFNCMVAGALVGCVIGILLGGGAAALRSMGLGVLGGLSGLAVGAMVAYLIVWRKR